MTVYEGEWLLVSSPCEMSTLKQDSYVCPCLKTVNTEKYLFNVFIYYLMTEFHVKGMWEQKLKVFFFLTPSYYSRCAQLAREVACSLPSQMPNARWWSWVWPSLQFARASRASYCTTLTRSRHPTATKRLPLASRIWLTSGHDSRWASSRLTTKDKKTLPLRWVV